MIDEAKIEEISGRLVERSKSSSAAATLGLLSTRGTAAWGYSTTLDHPVMIRISDRGYAIDTESDDLPLWIRPTVASVTDLLRSRSIDVRAAKYAFELLGWVMEDMTPPPQIMPDDHGLKMTWRSPGRVVSMLVASGGLAHYVVESEEGGIAERAQLPTELTSFHEALSSFSVEDSDDPALLAFLGPFGPKRTHDERASIMNKFSSIDDEEYFEIPEDLL